MVVLWSSLGNSFLSVSTMSNTSSMVRSPLVWTWIWKPWLQYSWICIAMNIIQTALERQILVVGCRMLYQFGYFSIQTINQKFKLELILILKKKDTRFKLLKRYSFQPTPSFIVSLVTSGVVNHCPWWPSVYPSFNETVTGSISGPVIGQSYRIITSFIGWKRHRTHPCPSSS